MTARIVSLVCGGFSFIEVDHNKLPGIIVSVNDAAVHLLRKSDEVVSMDRLWMENRWDFLKARALPFYGRRNAIKNLPGFDKLPWFHAFENQLEPTFEAEPALHGEHSGWCALNRCWQLRPDVLYIFGLDLALGPNGQRHWYAPQNFGPAEGTTSGYRPKRWADQMSKAKAYFDGINCAVVNVSSRSIITAFKRKTPVELGFGFDLKIATHT